MQGEGGLWYFLTPEGGLYRWDGGGATGPLVATLDPSYHAQPSLLYTAFA